MRGGIVGTMFGTEPKTERVLSATVMMDANGWPDQDARQNGKSYSDKPTHTDPRGFADAFGLRCASACMYV